MPPTSAEGTGEATILRRGMDAVVRLSVENTELNRDASELQPVAALASNIATRRRATGSLVFGDTLIRITRPTYYAT